MAKVVIGVDPHKRMNAVCVINMKGEVLARQQFANSAGGFRELKAFWRQYKPRRWAIEGCNGIGRHIAQRLVADGEVVVDVPAKLSARARVFSTGQGRKTDPVDAHSVALVGLHSSAELRVIAVDDATVALRLLVDRRDELRSGRRLGYRVEVPRERRPAELEGQGAGVVKPRVPRIVRDVVIGERRDALRHRHHQRDKGKVMPDAWRRDRTARSSTHRRNPNP